MRIWLLSSSQPPTFDATISSQGSAFINALTFIPPSKQYPQGLIISGGKDTIIEVRQPGTAPDSNAEALLVGHSHNICALDVDSTGQWIASGSWDGTARLWRVGKWDCKVVLEGHQGSVWAVMFWDDNTIVTGKLWCSLSILAYERSDDVQDAQTNSSASSDVMERSYERFVAIAKLSELSVESLPIIRRVLRLRQPATMESFDCGL